MERNESDVDDILKLCIEYRDKYGYTMFAKPRKISKSYASSLFFDGESSRLVYFVKNNNVWVVDLAEV